MPHMPYHLTFNAGDNAEDFADLLVTLQSRAYVGRDGVTLKFELNTDATGAQEFMEALGSLYAATYRDQTDVIATVQAHHDTHADRTLGLRSDFTRGYLDGLQAAIALIEETKED